MHRFKVATGIRIMLIVVIPLAIKIVIGIEDELSHFPQCLPLAPSNSSYMIPPEPCQDFVGDLKFILVYAGIFYVGLWLFMFGIKEKSPRSFAK